MKILPIHVYSCPLLLPLCQDVPGQAHTQPSWLCTSCPRNQPAAPSHRSRCGAVSVPPDPACEMYANGSEQWATSGRDTKGPLNPSLPRAVSPQRGVAAAWGINSSSCTAANVQVFRGLADSYFGKLWRWGAQRLGPFGPGITAGGTTFREESRAANGEC